MVNFIVAYSDVCLIAYESNRPMQAKPKLESGDLKSILDQNLDNNFNESEMQRMVLAVKLCLTQAARLRPKMSQV